MTDNHGPIDEADALREAVLHELGSILSVQDLPGLRRLAPTVAHVGGLSVEQVLALPVRDACAHLERVVSELEVQRAIAQLELQAIESRRRQ
jgi:hypothetical protein